MIYEIEPECFLKSISGNITEIIKAQSIAAAYKDTRAFKSYTDGEAFFILFGGSAMVFGEASDAEEAEDFLRLSGVVSASGEVSGFRGKRVRYSVMRAFGDGSERTAESIYAAARIMSDAFGLDFNEVYPDLCLRVNKGVAKVYCDGVSAAAVHTCGAGNLLTGVCVRENERGKGNGVNAVKRAKNLALGEVYVVCRESLEGFYGKNGFIKTAETEEIYFGEI